MDRKRRMHPFRFSLDPRRCCRGSHIRPVVVEYVPRADCVRPVRDPPAPAPCVWCGAVWPVTGSAASPRRRRLCPSGSTGRGVHIAPASMDRPGTPASNRPSISPAPSRASAHPHPCMVTIAIHVSRPSHPPFTLFSLARECRPRPLLNRLGRYGQYDPFSLEEPQSAPQLRLIVEDDWCGARATWRIVS